MKRDTSSSLFPDSCLDETAWKWQIQHFRGRYEVIVPNWHFDRPTIAAMVEAMLERLPPRFYPPWAAPSPSRSSARPRIGSFASA